MDATKDSMWDWLIIIGLVAAVAILPASWITHVIVCIQDEQWVLLVIGIFVFPIGVIHGIGSWFGLF